MSLLRTPANKWTFLGLLNLSWFGEMPAQIDHYEYHLRHGFYPIGADSIAIPIYQTWSVIIIFSPVVSALALMILHRSKLPAPLLYFPLELKLLNAFHTFNCVCLIVSIFSQAIVDDVPETFCWQLPVLLLQTYLLLSARAALLLAATNRSEKSGSER
jgi:hypothetical protein